MNAVGIIGLGPMGRNLAAHLVDDGFDVQVFSYNAAEYEASGIAGTTCPDLRTFVKALPAPRAILLMVKAGEPVDRVIADLVPLLAPGDTMIDGGNSHYRDTGRRCAGLQDSGIHFVGAGISGGAEGARHGASIMLGGDAGATGAVRPLFDALAAKADDTPCVVEAGPGGAGHFVKMVHNGIEYGVMQLISEVWQFAEDVLQMPHEKQAEMFRAWRGGPAGSFLVEITAEILGTRDETTGGRLLDVIADRAEHKGTGRWTLEAALELGIPVPTIAAALLQRQISASARRDRSAAVTVTDDDGDWPLMLESALASGMLCAFIQGFDLIDAANDAQGWQIDPAAVARAWRGGCIVRARMLDRFVAGNPYLPDDAGRDAMRELVGACVAAGLPVPAFAATLSWLDSLGAARLGTTLVQAQRDYFGAHTYERTDRSGRFSTDWS